MQKLGQHFLKNDAVIKKIIAALDLRAGDAVIEIGPGHGELTVPLAAACAAVGASLTAIEKDTKLADNLREKFSQEKINATIECGDALKILSSVITKTKNIPHLNLVGNLPYYITGKLLHIISEFEPEQMPERCVFMIQREVAERIIAAPPAMNRLAASVQFWADAEIIVQVPRSDFSPPPKIDSTVIALTTKPVIKSLSSPTSITSTAAHAPLSSTLYYRAVRAIFAQPRKTLLNNIAATSDSQNSTKKISTEALKEEISAQLKKTGINPLARPQDLSVDQIISIANALLWG